MNEYEIERIAAAVNQLRPDWPVRSLHTLLSKPEIANRPRRDVTVALAWVACEAATHTPARVLEAGPWWRAAGIEGQAQQREPFDASTFCGTCGEPRDRCERRWSGHHAFESVAHSKQRKGAVDIEPAVVELKGHIAPMRPPREPRPAPTTRRLLPAPDADPSADALHTEEDHR